MRFDEFINGAKQPAKPQQFTDMERAIMEGGGSLDDTMPSTGTVSALRKVVAEGKLNESAIFLNPNTVIVGQEHGKPLNLSPETMKRVQAIAAKHGAWYEGNGADRVYTKGQIDNYAGSFDDDVAKTASPNDPKWLYVLFANVDANNRVRRVGVDPKDTIFNRLLATAKDNSFQGIGFTAQALQKFLAMSSEGKYDFVKMSQQPATQENLTRFLKAGEALMWPANWEQYPNKAGKLAKAATVDARDQYLASRKAGVYVVGSGHLKAVQQITGKQGVAEAFDQPYKLTWEKGDHGDIDAYAQLPDGNYLSIMFNQEHNEDNEQAWSVEFYRNNSQEVTGEGDAQRVFATVLGAIQTFIKKYKPNRVIFSASKEVEPGQNAQSRANLYDRLVQRYAKSWGFKAFRADTGNKVIYELDRINKGVAENFADGKIKGKSRPGRVKRAGASCDGSVTDLRAKAKKYGGEKGKMYHWCANMKGGKK